MIVHKQYQCHLWLRYVSWQRQCKVKLLVICNSSAATASLTSVNRYRVGTKLVTLHAQAHGPMHPFHTWNDPKISLRGGAAVWYLERFFWLVQTSSFYIVSSWSRISGVTRHRNLVLAAATCFEWSQTRSIPWWCVKRLWGSLGAVWSSWSK
jgi:hypothetical protein